MKLIITALAVIPALALGQSLEETGTLHSADWLDIVLVILSTLGVGGVLSAWVPKRLQEAIPSVKSTLKYLGSNYRNAENKE